MAFVCPECHTSESLRITRSLELPPDSRSDEITLQIIRCSSCRFAGVAVYEESRRGRLDDETRHDCCLVHPVGGFIREEARTGTTPRKAHS